MKTRTASLGVCIALSLALGSVYAASQAGGGRDSMHLYQPDALQWKDGPPSLPAGARMAVLEGDPSKEGLFTMRLQLPDGFRIPPHFHGAVEHITVLSGTFNIGMGDRFDEKATTAMGPGAFGYWPAGMRHFVWTKGVTTLQLHGIGPWTITYVNPSDDPRKTK